VSTKTLGKHNPGHIKLRLGCSAVLFDNAREKILLTRRADNGLWCLPGGMIEAGESVAEGCAREVLEETGLEVRVTRLTGVYSDPRHLIVYPDGNRVHVVVLNFEVEHLGGVPGLSSETTEIAWFPVKEAMDLPLFHNHSEHIRDALEREGAVSIK
jgi:ADP-ribose pyrophosphatase YjhB (NUDIX family)